MHSLIFDVLNISYIFVCKMYKYAFIKKNGFAPFISQKKLYNVRIILWRLKSKPTLTI